MTPDDVRKSTDQLTELLKKSFAALPDNGKSKPGDMEAEAVAVVALDLMVTMREFFEKITKDFVDHGASEAFARWVAASGGFFFWEFSRVVSGDCQGPIHAALIDAANAYHGYMQTLRDQKVVA